MSAFARSDPSLLSRWWWTVDRWLLLALLVLAGVGFLLIFAASPSVAERVGLPVYHFAQRQFVFLAFAMAVMFVASLMRRKTVRRLGSLLFPIMLGLLYLTLLVGSEIKGATRWLSLGSFTFQPSELLKPTFIIFSAWMLSESIKQPSFPGYRIAMGAFLLTALGLVLQPDFGQAILLSMVFGAQLIIAGLPLAIIVTFVAAGSIALVVGYFFVPHIQNRLDAFLSPATSDTYQVDTALNALRAGNFFGTGPGEGMVKRILPDAHTDFIFAVAGEEFGMLACAGLLLLFTAIVVRILSHLLEEEELYAVLATGGLAILFGLQAFINIGVNLAVLPAKGMTLPFVSYGGSSTLAVAFGMGMVLALTRRNRFLKTVNSSSHGINDD